MILLFGLIILIFSAILHEVAHGFVADKLGDPTARLMGRLTLDPRKHIDPFMTILLPLLLIVIGSPVVFGAAKPVPVDPFNLKEGKKDVALVALAGPLTNILIAIAAAMLFRILSFGALQTAVSPFFEALIGQILYLAVTYNLLLGIFNLIPIPPLDRSKIVAQLLSDRDAATFLSLGQYGLILLFLLLFTPIAGFSLSQALHNVLAFAQSLLLR